MTPLLPVKWKMWSNWNPNLTVCRSLFQPRLMKRCQKMVSKSPMNKSWNVHSRKRSNAATQDIQTKSQRKSTVALYVFYCDTIFWFSLCWKIISFFLFQLIQVRMKKIPRFVCEICDKYFYSSYNLKRHSIAHSKAKLIFCSHCHKGFTRLERLVEHKKKEHLEIGSHSCRVCGKRFDRFANLKRHSILHAGNGEHLKRHACEVCGKGFSKLYRMRQHTNVVHLGLKPYTCDLCSNPFESIHRLKKHLDEAHPGQSHHICNLCEKVFSNSVALLKHKRIVHKELSKEFCKQ